MQPNQPLTLADHRLLDLVWPNQPLPSGRLCQIAQEQLGWKRTTPHRAQVTHRGTFFKGRRRTITTRATTAAVADMVSKVWRKASMGKPPFTGGKVEGSGVGQWLWR